MSSVNFENPAIDQTVRVFDDFYRYEVTVPAAQYDIVYSFFRDTMQNQQSAGNFAVSLFKVAEETGIPALTLLQGFQGLDQVQLNANLAYYLNQIRSTATLLGVSVAVVPNSYAARLVIQ
jgi:D-mannonate dehydratase